MPRRWWRTGSARRWSRRDAPGHCCRWWRPVHRRHRPGCRGGPLRGHRGVRRRDLLLVASGSRHHQSPVLRYAASGALQPVLSILLSPPGTASPAWFAITNGEIDHLQAAVGGVTFFTLLVQLFFVPAYLRLPFSSAALGLHLPARGGGRHRGPLGSRPRVRRLGGCCLGDPDCLPRCQSWPSWLHSSRLCRWVWPRGSRGRSHRAPWTAGPELPTHGSQRPDRSFRCAAGRASR